MDKQNKKSLLKILLAVSVCFNVFFISGYLLSRSTIQKVKTPQGRIELIARKIGLNDIQKKELLRLRGGLQDKINQMRTKHSADIELFWNEMLKDSPDSQKIKAILDSTSNTMNELNLEIADYLQNSFKILNSRQRQAYVQILRRFSLWELPTSSVLQPK